MKILITGGSGFIGSEVAKLLLKKKHVKLTILDIKKPNFIHSQLKFVKGNIKSKKLIKKLLKSQDVVYHFAGIADIGEASENPVKTIENNILPTVNIINECKNYKIKRFIFASTVYVYSSQGSFYKCSKKSCELYLQEFSNKNNLNFSILRYGTIYGPSTNLKNNINKITSQAIKRNIVMYEGKKNTKRRIIHAKDAARAAVEVLKKKYINKAVIIMGNKNYLMKDIMYKIKNKLNIKKEIIFKNKNIYGHYINNPYSEKKIPSVILKPKKQISIDKGIDEVVHFLSRK